jgi:hypothetical protein
VSPAPPSLLHVVVDEDPHHRPEDDQERDGGLDSGQQARPRSKPQAAATS